MLGDKARKREAVVLRECWAEHVWSCVRTPGAVKCGGLKLSYKLLRGAHLQTHMAPHAVFHGAFVSLVSRGQSAG